jgi:hypothetical protein
MPRPLDAKTAERRTAERYVGGTAITGPGRTTNRVSGDHTLLLVGGVLIAARLLLPLLIPRYPLLMILVCLIVDSADLSIMEAFGLYPVEYQSIDKALDIYYLSIAYVATMRNWENLEALQIARILFYLRLAGVLAFELSGARILLAVFPNAFEPFFIYYEIVRRRGEPMIGRQALIAATAVIWLAVKLPHEWWIHVARLDATDFIKTRILGASPTTSFWRAIIEAPVVTGTIMVMAAIIALAWWRVAKRRRTAAALAHRRDRRLRSRLLGQSIERALQARDWIQTRTAPIRPAVMAEKAVLVTLISMIIQETMPSLRANRLQTAVFITLTIIVADYLLRVIARRFGARIPGWLDIPLMAVVDFGVVLVFELVVPVWKPANVLMSAIVFAAVITFFVALYELYRPLYDRRREDRASLTRMGKLDQVQT